MVSIGYWDQLHLEKNLYWQLQITLSHATSAEANLLGCVGHLLESICLCPKVIPLSSFQIKNQVEEEKRTNIFASQLNTS